jgi:hypothetical protein
MVIRAASNGFRVRLHGNRNNEALLPVLLLGYRNSREQKLAWGWAVELSTFQEPYRMEQLSDYKDSYLLGCCAV